MGKLGSDFKAFIMRGNVVDMAVGVVIGAAFGAVVNGLVNNIIMPAVGMAIGGIDFSALSVNLSALAGVETETPAIIAYGSFIQAIINFLIIALCVFVFVRGIQKMREKREAREQAAAPPPAPPVKPEDIALLEEIRDLLKQNRQ